ncbi:exodeoxyribonuclease VII small subunit [bacterium]|nr:exodeoxyribonuclease VII small subunit [bacterium]
MNNKTGKRNLEFLVKITPKDIEAMSYEDALKNLEEVVEELEREGTQLELGLQLYEIGTNLSKRCSRLLDDTEAKMLQLLGTINSPREENFDPEKDGR